MRKSYRVVGLCNPGEGSGEALEKALNDLAAFGFVLKTALTIPYDGDPDVGFFVMERDSEED